MKTISLLFFFSGIAALTYEVLWVRHLGLIFGNTVYAAGTVMMTYMFGLAVGAHFAGKWAAKIKRPVRLFGILEVATALYALCVPLIFELIQILYRFAALHISDSLGFLTFVRVVLALVLLLIPTAMMGATLPVLSKGFLSRVERFGSRLGILYGVNTFGAVTGVLLCGFFLIPKLGMTVSNVVAVCLDASVGLIAIYLSRSMDKSPEIAEAIKLESIVEVASYKRGRLANGLLLAIGASGFLALAFEVVWFRALIQVFGSTTYSFSAMLAVFLIGLSLGSMAISRFADKAKKPALIFGVAAMLIGIYTLVSLGWFTAMPEFLLRSLVNTTPSWHTMIMLKFVITFIFLLVPTILFGASFTAAVKAIRSAMNSSPRAVGEAAMFNTIGASLGAFFGGFVLLPALGMETSLVWCAFFAVFLGVVLCLVFGEKKSRWMSVGVAGICVVGFLISPPHWDQKILSSGPHFSPWAYIDNGRVTLHDQLRSQRQLFYNEGLTATTSVILDANEDLHYSSHGKVEADTTERGMVIQRMMGHLPMLFHPNPQRVMNLGLGAGVTFGAVTCYPAEHLEVVEIEPSACDVSRYWSKWNHDVMSHPDIKVTINDGRNHLFVGGEPYDVITSDPFEPVVAGAGNLYTVEFFELARAQLSEGGFMAQFLPLYEMSNDDYQMIMRSFSTVFPDCVIFFTGVDTILVGSKGNADWSFDVLKEKFEIPAVKESLAEMGFTQPEVIFSMFVARVDTDDPSFTGSKVNTDNHPVIEFSTPKSKFHYTTDENQKSLLDHFSTIPESMLEGLNQEEMDLVNKSREALRMTLEANILRAQDNLSANIQLLIKAAELAPENPVVRNEVAASLMTSAQSVLNAGHIEQAVAQYQMILKYKPDEFQPIYHLVGLYMQLRDVESARKALAYGLERYPESPLFIALRGKFRASTGELDAGIKDLVAALQMLPDYRPFLEDYVFFLQQEGDRSKVEEVRRRIDQLSND